MTSGRPLIATSLSRILLRLLGRERKISRTCTRKGFRDYYRGRRFWVFRRRKKTEESRKFRRKMAMFKTGRGGGKVE